MSVMKSYKLLFTVLFVASAGMAFAQPGNPNTPVPFGAVEILTISALGYGAYQKYKNRK